MAPRVPILYQFPISHYCEKTRWNLDAKGLAYRVKDVLPGTHVALARRLRVPQGVPILLDANHAIADSTEIALHLERTHARPALLPTDAEARAKVLELEAFFDDHAGPEVRRYLYGKLMEKRGGAARALFRLYSRPTRVLGVVLGAAMEGALRKMYRIHPETVRSARASVLSAIERVERVTDGDPSRYLVGDRLTLADLTAASILAPVVIPPGTPWERLGQGPPEVQDLRAEARARAGGQWVLQRYREDRRRVLAP